MPAHSSPAQASSISSGRVLVGRLRRSVSAQPASGRAIKAVVMISDQPGVLYRWSSQRVPVAAPTTTAAWSGLQLGPLVRMYQMVSSAECPSRRYVQMSRPRAINVSRSMRTPPAVAVMTKAVSEMNFSSSGEGGSFGGGGGGGGWGGDGEFDGEGEVDCDADALALGDEEGAVGVAVAWVVSSVSSRCDPTTITAATAISVAGPR